MFCFFEMIIVCCTDKNPKEIKPGLHQNISISYERKRTSKHNGTGVEIRAKCTVALYELETSEIY